jgi:HPt (histidine-containing phosphotransfer) domain-containing protein/predicted peroxiredoxin
MNVAAVRSESPPSEIDHLRRELTRLAAQASAVAEANAHAAELMVALEEARDEVAAVNARMADILDNVEYGFFTVGPDHLVGAQVSASCRRLLGTDELSHRRIETLLSTDAEAQEYLGLCIDEVFADVLPELVTLGQIPERVSFGGRVLRLTGRALRDGPSVRAILFSIADVTSLEEQERENAQNRALIKILRQGEYFDEFVADLYELLEAARGAAARGDEEAVRRAIHTVKGNCGTFGLSMVAQVAHDVEERARIDRDTLDEVDEAVAAFFSRNKDVIDAAWPPSPTRSREYRVSEAQLAALLEASGGDDVRRWVSALRRVPVGRLLGPVDELVRDLGVRLEKPVVLKWTGADTPVDDRLVPVLRTLGHLLRNAVAHGLERAGERGDKPEVGTVELAIAQTEVGYEIVVADDGAGIDVDGLAAAALEQGFLTSEEAAALTVEDKLLLVFADGVSTARSVDQVAGRGVGMPAVRQAVESLGGTIRVRSERGRGTRFEMVIPKSAPQPPPVEDSSDRDEPSPPASEGPAQDAFDAQFVIVSGPEDAYRATLGVASALAALSSGMKVVCFFTMRGAQWTGDVDPQEAPVPGFLRVKELIAMLVEDGARMEGCTSCVESHLDAPRDASGRKKLAEGFVYAGLPEATLRMVSSRSAVF